MQPPAFRARSVPELLDAAFQVLRARYRQILTVSVVICSPAFVLGLLLPASAQGVADTLHALLATYASAAIAVIASDAYRGQQRGLGEVLRAVASRSGSIWWTAVLQTSLIAFGVLLLIAPGVIAFIVTFAMFPAVMLEGASTRRALARSRALARGNEARIFWTLALAYVAMITGFLGVEVVVRFLGGMAGGLSEAAITLVWNVALTTAYPLVATVSVLLYYDARIRNEAFDIEMLMEDAQGLAPAEAELSPA